MRIESENAFLTLNSAKNDDFGENGKKKTKQNKKTNLNLQNNFALTMLKLVKITLRQKCSRGFLIFY